MTVAQGIEVQVGSTITNGSSAIRITELVERDPTWKTSGWRGISIPLEQFGGNPGMSQFVPDYLIQSWHHVPFEWTPLVGAGVEHRYVWTPDWRRLQHEVRRIEVPVDCQAEHGAGHPDCPKCWRWSERNPNAVPRP